MDRLRGLRERVGAPSRLRPYRLPPLHAKAYLTTPHKSGRGSHRGVTSQSQPAPFTVSPRLSTTGRLPTRNGASTRGGPHLTCTTAQGIRSRFASRGALPDGLAAHLSLDCLSLL